MNISYNIDIICKKKKKKRHPLKINKSGEGPINSLTPALELINMETALNNDFDVFKLDNSLI